jgi:hypothetical protein
MKETCYLSTLVEHYKDKAKKYKRMLRDTSSVSIELESENSG